LPSEVNNPDRLALAQQWHAKPGAHLADRDHLRQSVFWIGGEIGNLDRLTREQSPRYDAPASWLEGKTPHARVPFGRKRES